MVSQIVPMRGDQAFNVRMGYVFLCKATQLEQQTFLYGTCANANRRDFLQFQQNPHDAIFVNGERASNIAGFSIQKTLFVQTANQIFSNKIIGVR